MIKPSHRLMLAFDIHPARQQRYFDFMTGEFVPMLQQMGMHMIFVWQVVGQKYPERQVEFICGSQSILRTVLLSDRFQNAEDQLKSFTISYRRKVVVFEDRYQF